MGSPLSPILADYVMEDLLDGVIGKLCFTVPVITKYVDDLFIALPRNEIDNTLTTFNQYNPHLQFTVEIEENAALPFLDTVVVRSNDQTLTTRWYSKPIASGRLLNFLSLHPTSMKINVATNLIKRVTSLSTGTSIDQQKHIIFQHLRQNNYPASLINRLLSHIRNQHQSQQYIQQPPENQHVTPIQPTPPTQPSPPDPPEHPTAGPSSSQTAQQEQHPAPPEYRYRSISNIPVLTQSITAILKRDYPDVKIAPKTIKTTQNLLQPVKDPVLPQQQYNVIYSIPCNNCEKVYIGMTTNHLKKRLSGHQSNINKINNASPTTQHIQAKTALTQHMIEHQHTFNLCNTAIVDRAFRSSALPMLEMCHISNTPNTVNFRTDVDGLNATYAGVLNTVKNTLSRRERLHDTRNRSTQNATPMSGSV